MYVQNLQYFLLIIVICVGTAEITVGLQNTAVKKGENVTLDCWVNIREENEVVIWNLYRANENWLKNDTNVTKVFQDEPLFIEDGYGNLTDIYPRLRRYRLIIQNASRNHAGKYACVLEKEKTTQEAELIVVDPLRCTPGLSEIEVDVGETVTVDCGVRSLGKYSARLDMWSADGHINSSSWILPVETYLSVHVDLYMYVEVTAALDGQANVCAVSFDYLADEEFVGITVPRYYDECRTILRVNKPWPTDMQILRNMDVVKNVFDVEIGDNITCTARGRPEPKFWISNNYDKTDVINGSVMTIEERHMARSQSSYTCYAQISDGTKINENSQSFRINGRRDSGGYQDVSSALSIIIVALFTLLLQR